MEAPQFKMFLYPFISSVDPIGIGEQTKCTLITTAKSLFNDDLAIWPLHSSLLLPRTNTTALKLVQNIRRLSMTNGDLESMPDPFINICVLTFPPAGR
jgi:hypothetical protein